MVEGARRIAPTAQPARGVVENAPVYEIRRSKEAEADFKALREPLDDLRQAEWNVRVGDYRVLYCVVEGPTVQVLRVILKGTSTLEDALARSIKS